MKTAIFFLPAKIGYTPILADMEKMSTYQRDFSVKFAGCFYIRIVNPDYAYAP